MKYIIVCFIFSLLFSHYTYGQQTGKFQNYKITDSVFSGMLKIESNNASKERLTMARFKILNEKSLIKDVQKIFYKSLRTLKKDKIVTKCLKNDFDSLKIESSIILAYKWDGKITDVSYDLSPFIVNEVLSEKWIEDTQNYKDFISMTEALKKDIHRLSALNINSDINTLLKEMFGETVTNDAIKEYAKSIGVQRDKGNLSVDSAGRLNISNEGNKIRKNTFYGEA